MNGKLIFKNSWHKFLSDWRIMLVLFLYLLFAFAVIFGLFGISSQTNLRLILLPQTTGVRSDGSINNRDLRFFSENQNDQHKYGSKQYSSLILAGINQDLSDDMQLDPENNSDDLNYLQILDQYYGSVANLMSSKPDLTEQQIAVSSTLINRSESFLGNIYQSVLAKLVSTTDDSIYVQPSYRFTNALFAENDAFLLSEDLANNNLRLSETPTDFQPEEGYVSAYLMSSDYKRFAGQNTFLTINSEGGISIPIKIVGRAVDHTNMIRKRSFNFVADTTNLFRFFQKEGVKNIDSPVLQFEDSKILAYKTDVTRINKMLSSLGDLDIYNDQVAQYGSDKVEQLYVDTNNNFVNYDSGVKVLQMSRVVMVIIVAMLLLLTAAIMYFVTKQLINGDRKILYFLKSIGTTRAQLAWINVIDVFYPIIFALLSSVPLTFFIQNLFYNSISAHYNFIVPFFSMTWTTPIMMIVSFSITVLLFFILVLINVSPEVLNPQNIYALPAIEETLNKFKPFMKKVARLKNDLTISFLIKNFYQNVVTFFVFTVAIGLSLYGTLFSYSANQSLNASANFYHPYTTRSDYTNATQLAVDDKLIERYEFNDEMTIEENMKLNDARNRQVKINLNETDPENSEVIYYDVDGKKTVSGPDALAKISDWNGRYFSKEDINTLINSDSDYSKLDSRLGVIVDKIKSKMGDIKSHYKNYDGTSVSFNMNYESDNDGYATEAMPIEMFSTNKLKSSDASLTILNDDVKNQFNFYDDLDLGTSSRKIDYNFAATDTLDSKIDSLIPDEDYDEAADFVSFNELYQNNNIASTTSISLPAIDVVVSKQIKDQISGLRYFSLPIIHDNITNQTLYIPLYFNVVKYDSVNPVGDIYVNEDSLRNVVNQEFEKLKSGLVTYLNLNRNSRYQVFANVVDQYQLNLKATNFYTNDVPKGYANLVLSPEGDPNNIENYNVSNNFLDDYPIGISDFQEIKRQAYETLSPVILIINDIANFSLIIAVLVAILLIYLILKENNKIISILKIMGYRKREITRYIIFGYTISSILASGVAIGLSFAMFKISATVVSEIYNYDFAFYFSAYYIAVIILAPIMFLSFVWLSIFFLTRKSNVNSITQAE